MIAVGPSACDRAWPSSRATTSGPPQLDGELEAARAREAAAAAEVAVGPPSGGPRPGRRIQANLVELAMPKAGWPSRSRVDDPGDDVEVPLAANPGTRRCRSPRWPRVASWRGPCSRCASCSPTRPPPSCSTRSTRASAGPRPSPSAGRWPASGASTRCSSSPTCRRWRRTPTRRCRWPSTATTRRPCRGRRVLDPDERVVELSRMLSGQPDSDAARTHAAELLATAAGDRGR